MYLPTKHISTHPRYVGSGVFGSLGKVVGRLASKVSGETAKKLANKAVSTAGEQASKAILKKSQAIADEKAAQLIDLVTKKVTKSKKEKPKVETQLVSQLIKEAISSKGTAKDGYQESPSEIINRRMAGLGIKSKPKGAILKLEDIISRGINTPFLPPAYTGFTGSGIKTI